MYSNLLQAMRRQYNRRIAWPGFSAVSRRSNPAPSRLALDAFVLAIVGSEAPQAYPDLDGHYAGTGTCKETRRGLEPHMSAGCRRPRVGRTCRRGLPVPR